MERNPNGLLYGADDIFADPGQHPDSILKDLGRHPDSILRNHDEALHDAIDILAEQRRPPRNNEEDPDLPDPSECIVCETCSYEYDRHVGDICPVCSGNNHNQYVSKFGD